MQKRTGYEYYGLPASGGVSFGSPGILNSIAFSLDGTKVVIVGTRISFDSLAMLIGVLEQSRNLKIAALFF